MPKIRKRVLITDLDNTLWDWVAIWQAPFRAMLDEIVKVSGVPEEELLPEIQVVHRKHRTSEYAFLIEELPTLRAKHPNQDLTRVYSTAIDAFRAARTEVLHPYADVVETLEALAAREVRIVAYTESLAFYTAYRLRRTGIDKFLEALYSPPDHELPAPRGEIRKYPEEAYELATDHRYTPPDELKPNPKLLADILESIGVGADEAVYVGDSPMKDIDMAQRAGVLDVHAAYGAAQCRKEYDLLRAVSHWSDEDIQREKEIMSGTLSRPPSITLDNGYGELLSSVAW